MGLRGNIIAAIQSDLVSNLFSALREANRVLVGIEDQQFSAKESVESYTDFLKELQEFLNRIRTGGWPPYLLVYLEDMGFSRLMLNVAGGVISVLLTNNSSKKVKERWQELQ